MALWVPLYETIRGHKKVWRLMELLGVHKVVAVGHLALLWTWALTNALDGDLSCFPDKAIAEAAEWKKKPATFVNALKDAGFLDDDRRLHDWDEYTTSLQELAEHNKEQTKNRVRRYRDRKKAEADSVTQDAIYNEGNVTVTPDVTLHVTQDVTPGNVDVTHCNAPTVTITPTVTLPKLRRDAARAPVGDLDEDGADIVSLDYHRVLDAAARHGFPADVNRIDKNCEFCADTYGAEWSIAAIEKTASVVADGRHIGSLWKYAKGILRGWKANGGMDDAGAVGSSGPSPPATSGGYFELVEHTGREVEMSKDEFDETIRRYRLRQDVEVEITAPNRFTARRKAVCGTGMPTPRSP